MATDNLPPLCEGPHDWIFVEQLTLAEVDHRGVYKIPTTEPAHSNVRVYSTYWIFHCRHCLSMAKVQVGTGNGEYWILERLPSVPARVLGSFDIPDRKDS